MINTEISDIKAAIAELVAYNLEAERQRAATDEKRRKEDEKRQQEEEKIREEDEKRRLAAELDRKENRRTDDLLKKQMGELGNKLGGYTEGLVQPSARRIVKQVFGAEHVGENMSSTKNGQNVEYDVMGYSNGSNNIAVIVEIKSTAREEDIPQLLDQLRKFPLAFPEHKDKKLYGVLAAVNIPMNVRGLLRKNGLHLIGPRGEEFELDNPPDFTAKNYQAERN